MLLFFPVSWMKMHKCEEFNNVKWMVPSFANVMVICGSQDCRFIPQTDLLWPVTGCVSVALLGMDLWMDLFGVRLESGGKRQLGQRHTRHAQQSWHRAASGKNWSCSFLPSETPRVSVFVVSDHFCPLQLYVFIPSFRLSLTPSSLLLPVITLFPFQPQDLLPA